ncbi:splicing factor [Polyrhizophydium stewartii]|uniref:Splicing factor n=1 Tax=Polyrhizophydium stewartii TaxID=2732419 RepID=A0ABR4NL31_9FUNG
MDYQRQLLEELMNPLLPTAKKDFRDQDVCKHFLVEFCPNDMFLNTKADLGRCFNLHDEKLQREYHESSARGSLGYEQRFYDYLQQIVDNIDRTIRKGLMRVEARGPSSHDNGPSPGEIRERIIIAEETIKSRVGQIQQLAEAGRVKEAFDLSHSLELTMAELESMRQSDSSTRMVRSGNGMEVCEICGALVANDSTGARVEEHLSGKQHNGFIKIRASLEARKKAIAAGTAPDLAHGGAGGAGGAGGGGGGGSGSAGARDYRGGAAGDRDRGDGYRGGRDYRGGDRDYRGGDRDYRGGGGGGYRGGGAGGGGGYRDNYRRDDGHRRY